MPRQILSETQEEPKSNGTHTASETSATTKSNETVLPADVLKRLFCEWENVERGDLSVDTTLAGTITEYLKYQEELDPLRKKLAARMYLPFIMEKINGGTEYDIFIDDWRFSVYLCKADNSDKPRGIPLSDLKTIAIALNITYANYFPSIPNTYIDLFSFCNAHGLNFNLDTSDRNITIERG